MEAALRSQTAEDRRTTQDGRIWPVERARMQSGKTIRERMVEDIQTLARVDGEFASLSLDDLGRKGWMPEQVRQHGSTAFNLFHAQVRAEAKTTAARRHLRERDSAARMALDAAALAIFIIPVLFWSGRFAGAL
jgi:hypothetical protein